MLCNKHSYIRLIPLVFALLLLVACSSIDTLPKPTPTAQPAGTMAPGNGGGTGRIALACAPDPAHQRADICVSNLDGSGLQRLTSGPGPNVSPDWSPDGKRLVFRAANADIFEASDIWIMNADGGNPIHRVRDEQENRELDQLPDHSASAGASMNLVKQSLPASLGKKVRHDRKQPLHRRTGPFVEVIFAS